MTLVELMVSMAIFTVVTSLAIGAFITILNMRIMAGNMKNTQQKVRVAVETITRMAKQAEKVNLEEVSLSQTLTLYFNLSDPDLTRHSAVKFIIKKVCHKHKVCNINVLYARCSKMSISGELCDVWEDSLDFFEGDEDVKIHEANFDIEGTYPPKLKFILQGVIGSGSISKAYYNDEINIETKVILENIK
jgi:hypothetical protein